MATTLDCDFSRNQAQRLQIDIQQIRDICNPHASKLWETRVRAYINLNFGKKKK